jgi:hypothetical protein
VVSTEPLETLLDEPPELTTSRGPVPDLRTAKRPVQQELLPAQGLDFVSRARRIEHVFDSDAGEYEEDAFSTPVPKTRPGSSSLLRRCRRRCSSCSTRSLWSRRRCRWSCPGPQALADTAALLGAIEQLHVAVLGRIADVDCSQAAHPGRLPVDLVLGGCAADLDRPG